MSCSLRSCGFGRVQKKSNLGIKPLKSRKGRKLSRRINKERSRTSKKRSRRTSKRRSRGFGFKYLRNDQIINSVFHNYPQDLTCDRA